MKLQSKCPKCSKPAKSPEAYECGSNRLEGCGSSWQSELCRERVKVQRLKRKVERLTERAEVAEIVWSGANE